MLKNRLFISALLAISAITISAQTVQMEARMGSESTVSPLPKELTNDGKAYMTVFDLGRRA